MIDFNKIGPSSWPFEEARKVITRLNGKLPEKGYVLFETGYGPSGLPHIGTFGEVFRTLLVKHAYTCLTGHKTRLFAFSDDMDGLRKVPTNLPKQEELAKYIGMPLTKVMDPFGKFDSFAAHNNQMLRDFLDSFNFEYEFFSATELYKKGEFNSSLAKVLENYDKIMEIMLPSLGEERQASYSPILPISPKTGRVLLTKILKIDTKNYTVVYKDEDGEEIESSIFDGKCKLQWKADWAMRWVHFDVDYEMFGKDLIPTYNLSQKIAEAVGSRAPNKLAYELFLDEEGKKISKSKGNGFSMEEWLRYGPAESLSIYMYQNPQRAKKLALREVPKKTDEWLMYVKSYHEEEDIKKRIDNPVWHLYKGDVPKISLNVSFAMILNLVIACKLEDIDVIAKFIKKYNFDIAQEDEKVLRQLIQNALNYYKDFVEPNLNFRTPNDKEKEAILTLKAKLQELGEISEQELQNMVYQIGQDFGFELKEWFKLLYETLLGQSQGPRVASFFTLFGVNNVVQLIEDKLNG